ncbi:MAG: hypothetical protein LLF86_08910 [Nitrospiraceae bacterium]|nr:hypothetical protein [Nitrospiraceae bacterium]
METPRTEIEELKRMLGKNEKVLVVDVRQPASYAESDKMIAGAIYIDPGNDEALNEFAKQHNTDERIVFY